MRVSVPSLIGGLQIVFCNFSLPVVQHPLAPAKIIEADPSDLFPISKGSTWSLSHARSFAGGSFNVAQTKVSGFLSRERLALFLLSQQREGNRQAIVAITGNPHGNAQLPVVIYAHWRNRILEPKFKRDRLEIGIETPTSGWHLYTNIGESSPLDHTFPADSKVLFLG